MLQILVEIPIKHINFGQLISKNKHEYVGECQQIISTMIKNNLYRRAKDLAREAGMSLDKIIMAEVKAIPSLLIRFGTECLQNYVQ